MINLQQREANSHDPDRLDVQEIFATIQGEGPFAGRPAVFVRLAGCNLQCPGCDTDYTSKRKPMTVNEIFDQVCERTGDQPTSPFADPRELVVITGGEPFRQSIGKMVCRLLERFRVQIETNGVIFREDFPWDNSEVVIVCSPKTIQIPSLMHDQIDAYKYVVEYGRTCPRDGLPLSVLGNDARVARPQVSELPKPVYVQPMDEGTPAGNMRNMEEAVQVCMRFGYTLCLQMHKIARLP